MGPSLKYVQGGDRRHIMQVGRHDTSSDPRKVMEENAQETPLLSNTIRTQPEDSIFA